MVLGPTLRKILPYFNFIVATSALGFQVAVLYPWHKQLDDDFKIMKEQQQATLAQYHELKLDRLNKIEDKISTLRNQSIKTSQQERELLEHEFARNKLKQYIDLQNLET